MLISNATIMQNLFKEQTIQVLSSLITNPLYKQNTEKQSCQESYICKTREWMMIKLPEWRANDDAWKCEWTKTKTKIMMESNYLSCNLLLLFLVHTKFLHLFILLLFVLFILNMTISSSWVTTDLNGCINICCKILNLLVS